MNNEKFYTLKTSQTKDNCAECKAFAGRIYPKSKLPALPLHPNCACTITEILTLVMPKYIINIAKEKTKYPEMLTRFPSDTGKLWYKSFLNNENEFIIFSNDSIIFYTSDGGVTLKKLLITSDEYMKLMNLQDTASDDSTNKPIQVTPPEIVEKIASDLIPDYTTPKLLKELLDKYVDDYKAAYKIYNNPVISQSLKDQAKADMDSILAKLKAIYIKTNDSKSDNKIADNSEQGEEKWWHVLKNKDGTYSLYDNQRNAIPKPFHEQIFVFEVGDPSFSYRTIGIPSVSVSLLTGGWEFENIDLSLLDFLTAEIAAEVNSKTGFEVGAMVSIWSPSVTISIGRLDIEFEANIGSLGKIFKYDGKEVKFGASQMFGFSISFILKD